MKFAVRPTSLTVVVVFLFLVLPPTAAVSQALTSPTQPPRNDEFRPSIDLSVGAFGQLTATRNPMTTDVTYLTQKTQSYSPSAGVLGTFHQSFRPWLGYNVNLGYTRLTQSYSNAQGFIPKSTTSGTGAVNYSHGALGTSMYELTIAYVAEGPRSTKLRTFAQLGGGGLFFLPRNAPRDAIQQTRPAMVFGVGMEYKFNNHLGLRTEYRGLFHKGPDYAIDTVGFPKQRLFTVTSTPSVGLVYRFK